MKIEPSIIKEKFVHAQRYLTELENVVKQTKEEYMNDLGLQLKAERLFEVISQIILDICTHIVSREEKEDPPKNYGDCMLVLEKMGILYAAAKEGARFRDMIKVRNFIVHDYARIDNTIVYTALKQLASDFAVYQARVLAWLSTYHDPSS